MKVDKHERNVLMGALLVLGLWFGYFLDQFYNIANGNSILYYFLFLLVYVFLISKFFFGESHFKVMISFFVVLLVSDIILPPYILTKETAPELSDNLQFSSDFFIYSLLPISINHTVRFYLTYIGFPVLALALLALMFDRRKFMNLLRQGA